MTHNQHMKGIYALRLKVYFRNGQKYKMVVEFPMAQFLIFLCGPIRGEEGGGKTLTAKIG